MTHIIGMYFSQRYFLHGFGLDPEHEDFPSQDLFSCDEHGCNFTELIQDVPIKNTTNPKCQGCWYIIKDKSATNLEEIAYEIVKHGEDSALQFIPIAKFRNLKIVDRTEIEAFQSIKNLISEYIQTDHAVRPLSIAVFGTPGSGKSFGVTEVAASIAPTLIQKIDFNLSQFRSVDDLIAAFHKVRDIVLIGKLPLVFFDEFDSTFEENLGWLKYFLAPMQDGNFREGDSTHPIGKAIFVFAGGTSSTYESFCGEVQNESSNRNDSFSETFKNAKGPDFISRLRGYVNILGPNQTDRKWDQLYIIRRAMLLRSLLVRKTPYLINDNGEAQVDDGIIRALLKVPKYKHEARSMEAIIDMSMLTGAKKWEQSLLPSKNQLKLHVDEEEFYHFMMQEELFSEKLYNLSLELFNQYKALCLVNDSTTVTSHTVMINNLVKSWIREQVKNIPHLLYKVNYELSMINETPTISIFTKIESEHLAQCQHELWLTARKKEGWSYGDVTDDVTLTSKAITTWDDLCSSIKEAILQYIQLWPKVLVHNKLKIVKLNYLCYCESHKCDKKD